MTVRGWSTLAIGGIVAAWALAGLLLWSQYAQAASEQMRYLTTWAPATAQASVLGRAQAATAAAVANAALRGNARQADHAPALLEQMSRSARQLGRLLEREPTERLLARHAWATQEAWVHEDVEPMLAAVQAGQLDSAAGLGASDQAAQRIEAMRSASQVLHARVHARALAAAHAMAGSSRQLQQALVIAMALLITFIIIAALALRLGIVKPLAGLRRNLRRTALDPAQRIPSTGPLEIASVAANAESLRLRLIDQEIQSRAARQALGVHAPLVAELRALLHGAPVPELPGMGAYASTRPAIGVIGGDWWQFVLRPDGTHCLVLGDVSGHGWECGLMAVQLRAILATGLRSGSSLTSVLAGASGLLDGGEFTVSVLLMELYPNQGKVCYVNAGHPPAAMFTRDGSIDMLGRTGPLLSCLPTGPDSWQVAERPWKPSQVLICHSDGLPGLDSTILQARGSWITTLLQEARDGDSVDPAELGSRLLGDRRAWGSTVVDDASLIVVVRT